MPQHTSGSPALRVGALFGLIWGVLLIANYYLVTAQGVRATSIASLVLALVVYLVAGYLAAARTGLVRTGLLAGLWTGFFSSLLNAIGVTVLLLSDPAVVEKIRQASLRAAQAAGQPVPALTNGLIIASSVVTLVLGLIAATVVGLGVGALGGLIGKSRAPRAPASQPYRETLYQSPSSPPEPPTSAPPPPEPGQRDEPR